MVTTAQSTSTYVPGRACNDCALCCKVMGIGAIEKPAGEWCPHCPSKQGCAIYESRPQECADFNCAYLIAGWLGEEWQPLKSRMVISLGDEGRKLTVFVEPQRADAWRREPYYSQIRNWGRSAGKTGAKVMVSINRRIFAILPDRELDLGVVGEDEIVVYLETPTPNGVLYDAKKMPRDQMPSPS